MATPQTTHPETGSPRASAGDRPTHGADSLTSGAITIRLGPGVSGWDSDEDYGRLFECTYTHACHVIGHHDGRTLHSVYAAAAGTICRALLLPPEGNEQAEKSALGFQLATIESVRGLTSSRP